MNFVTKRSDIISNLEIFEGYMNSKKKEEKAFAQEEILKQDLLLIYKVDGENCFAPARFVAFKKNAMKTYGDAKEILDKDITNNLTKIVGLPFSNGSTEERFTGFGKEKLGKKSIKLDRTFWRLKDERGKNFNMSTKK